MVFRCEFIKLRINPILDYFWTTCIQELFSFVPGHKTLTELVCANNSNPFNPHRFLSWFLVLSTILRFRDYVTANQRMEDQIGGSSLIENSWERESFVPHDEYPDAKGVRRKSKCEGGSAPETRQGNEKQWNASWSYKKRILPKECG